MENIFKIPTESKNGKHPKLNYGTSIVNFMAQDAANKLGSRKLNGIDNATGDKEKDLIYRSDFPTQRAFSSIFNSFDGSVLCGIMFNSENQSILKFLRIVNFQINLDRNFEWFTAKSLNYKNDFGNLNGEEVFVRFSKVYDNNNNFLYILREYVSESIVDKKLKPITSANYPSYKYPKRFKEIPFRSIRNDEGSKPDWYNIVGFVEDLNVLSNDLSVEWEFIKTEKTNNAILGKGKSNSAVEKEILNGERIRDNSVMGSSVNTIFSGSQSLQQLISYIAFLEDRTMKFAFQGRDMDTSGNNKHNLQVGLFNQAHSENLQKKKEIRERDFKSFFKDIVNPMLGTEFDIDKIKFDISEFEKGKLEGIKLAEKQNSLITAQASQQRAQAKNINIQATKEIKSTKKVKPEDKEENNLNSSKK